MKTTIFWDITPYSPLIDNRRFGRTYLVHLRGRRIKRARNHPICHLLSGWFLARLISLKPTRLQVKTFLRRMILNQCLSLLQVRCYTQVALTWCNVLTDPNIKAIKICELRCWPQWQGRIIEYREEPKLNSPDNEMIWKSPDDDSEESVFRIHPEDGSSRFLRKFSSDLSDYMTSFLRRHILHLPTLTFPKAKLFWLNIWI
jgi:hypothetical protein